MTNRTPRTYSAAAIRSAVELDAKTSGFDCADNYRAMILTQLIGAGYVNVATRALHN